MSCTAGITGIGRRIRPWRWPSLLASMKDDDGRVLIDHFYDGIQPLTDIERRAIAEAPDVDQDLMRELVAGPHRRRRKKAGGAA